jgi:ribosomal protein S18 acetylase RimI-like enzyme
MILNDIAGVKKIDDEAFVPIWRNSLSALKLAFQQATFAAVAVVGDKIIGYHISTLTQLGGHVARLAVHPQAQRKGIGFAILCDVLRAFKAKGTRIVTVNTQNDNIASLALYRKAGFKITGEEYPFYQIDIN